MKMMNSQGWRLKIWVLVAGCLLTRLPVFAGSLTVRNIELQGGGVARILLDTVPPKGAVNLEFVRDNVQLTILNSTIYPAKILHADSSDAQAFSKVFAYQYAPNLVRVRFSVEGRADRYQGKVKIENKGRGIVIAFPAPIAGGAVAGEEHERSLLDKVLAKAGEVKPFAASPEKTVEKISAKEIEKESFEQETASKARDEKAREEKPREEKSKAPAAKGLELGGKPHGPSTLRSLLSMFLVVGGLGMILIYLKRKKGVNQAKRVGDSWITNLFAGGKKDKPYIEVLANHALGPKQSITVVRIKEQQFVLGVTQDSVQLITQLDSDDADFDLLEDPKVADSIGRMFGAKVSAKPEAP
ncbi:MAG: hypothetical protein EBX52_10800, partial [Proteobacteria bacterium]|nr:hypothetical protein [Pseudomonadota bacterium]